MPQLAWLWELTDCNTAGWVMWEGPVGLGYACKAAEWLLGGFGFLFAAEKSPLQHDLQDLVSYSLHHYLE